MNANSCLALLWRSSIAISLAATTIQLSAGAQSYPVPTQLKDLTQLVQSQPVLRSGTTGTLINCISQLAQSDNLSGLSASMFAGNPTAQRQGDTGSGSQQQFCAPADNSFNRVGMTVKIPSPATSNVNANDYAYSPQRALPSPMNQQGMLSGSAQSSLLQALTHQSNIFQYFGLAPGTAHNSIRLNAEERRLISNSDVAIILDHSGSMRTRDCPSGNQTSVLTSRLTWADDEMQYFADDILAASPHGISLITFDDHPDIYQISSATDLRSVTQSLRSGGGTRLDLALQAAFNAHEQHRDQRLLVAVVTDAEIDLRSSERTLIAATQRYPLPNGVFVTLLQVGCAAEIMNRPIMSTLEHLPSLGAAYNVYADVPFSQLRAEGFGRGILTALRR